MTRRSRNIKIMVNIRQVVFKRLTVVHFLPASSPVQPQDSVFLVGICQILVLIISPGVTFKQQTELYKDQLVIRAILCPTLVKSVVQEEFCRLGNCVQHVMSRRPL